MWFRRAHLPLPGRDEFDPRTETRLIPFSSYDAFSVAMPFCCAYKRSSVRSARPNLR
jgi:hypothetical protein